LRRLALRDLLSRGTPRAPGFRTLTPTPPEGRVARPHSPRRKLRPERMMCRRRLEELRHDANQVKGRASRREPRLQCSVDRVPAPTPHDRRSSPSSSSGGQWGWCCGRCRSVARPTPSPPNPPLEGEGFKAESRGCSAVWTKCRPQHRTTAALLPPLQGEGWGGDGVAVDARSVAGPTPSPPNPPLEGEGFRAESRGGMTTANSGRTASPSAPHNPLG
jgi:hypothetical protein